MMNSAYCGTSISEMMVQPTKNEAIIVMTIGLLCRYSMWKTGSSALRSTLPKAMVHTAAAANVVHSKGEHAEAARFVKSISLMPSKSSMMAATSRTDPAVSKRWSSLCSHEPSSHAVRRNTKDAMMSATQMGTAM